ncbi:MAG TPA: flagellar basal body P-ring formation chaperone FlgA [Tepidisphaeraceae bacterium]|jgi:flagella basal body P-ring formation protein FlgA|nr:flagellar basal body P-ring formation chaperone FlgA [Tepidisphaeraceae bacterium]
MTGRPIGTRKKANILIALTLLAWATQTLLRQWAHGAEPGLADQFVPRSAQVTGGATLELKAEAAVAGEDVRLRQVCRWSDADANAMAPLSDLTIAHLKGTAPFQSVSLDEIRQTLRDAGVNLGVIRFAGATGCIVSRTDLKQDAGSTMLQWIDAREGKAPATSPLQTPVNAMTAGAALAIKPLSGEPVRSVETQTGIRSLRDLIIADAAVRLNIPIDQLQITFNPADDKILNLSEPQFKFNLTARRVYGLGDVAWDVLVVTDAMNKKIPIGATARAWQKQVILARPVAYKAIVQSDDLVEKRILTDHLPDATLLTMAQCVGQEASRDLKPGTVMVATMVDAVDLAKPGQFITVTLNSGGIRITTVGRAMESGTYGQSVKVKNEATREIYQVILTGAQEGTISPPSLEKKVAGRKGG